MGIGKRGLALEVFIGLIVAVAGFIIVLFFLGKFNFGQSSEKQVCELSVLTRATAPSAVQGYSPLKCTTQKICLTRGRLGKCKQFAGEDDVLRVRLPDDEKAIRMIEEVSANAMYDCWDMMGQGKLDLFGNFAGKFGFDAAKSTCVICSRVAIDAESLSNRCKGVDLGEILASPNEDCRKDVENIIGKVDINKYMETHTIPGKDLTYLQAFTDRGVSAFASVKDNSFSEKLEKEGKVVLGDEEGKGSDVKLRGNSLNLEMAFVFMQIKSEKIEDVLSKMLGVGASVAGGAFMTPILGKAAGAVVFHPVGAVITAIGVAGVGGYGAYNAYQGQLAAAGYCGVFASTAEAKEGCSLVQGVNYNFRDINTLCHKIEGNP